MKYFLLYLLFFSLGLSAQQKFNNAGKLALQVPEGKDLLVSENGQLHVLVRTAGSGCDSALRAEGIHINGRFGEILSLHLTLNQLERLAALPCINAVEAPVRANAARLKNDVERLSSSVDKVQAGSSNGLPQNYTGSGVVLGIVDVGFQCDHPTFRSSDGKRCRIVRYWQQNNRNGTPPAGFSYGSELTDSNQILQANDMDGSHGTHVAGIAGGSGLSTPGLQYRGMAPGTDLVFVSIKYSNDTLAGSALGDYIVANPTILDAYKYIFDYAASVGKPAVINLSWGMHTGPHDGSSLFDQATESLTGIGRILVGAAGNEGDNPMHLQHRFNNDTVSTIVIENGRQWRQRESVYADFWGSAGSRFSIRIRFIDTLRRPMASSPFISSLSDSVFSYRFIADSAEFKATISCVSSDPNNGKPNITITADHQNQRKYAIIADIFSDSSEVHGWNSGASREWTSGSFRNRLNNLRFEDTYLNGNSDYTAGENGGTSKAVISVGALAARTAFRNVKGVWINDSAYVLPGQIARFSSRGPTTDGRVKPNISAPGFDIPSSVNNRQFAGWMLDRTLLKTVFRNDTQYWSAFNGTSMAAPHVAGIVALLLQARPALSAEQVRTILENSAVADLNTGSVPNMRYGYGKVNAYEAMLKTLQLSGINAYQKGPAPVVYPNPFGDYLRIRLPSAGVEMQAEICSMDGRTLFRFYSDGQQPVLEIPGSDLPAGFYYLKCSTGGEIFIFQLLKN